VELITKPSILFLDEPTSGLDSYAAYVVVNILKDLARSGCTVLCTIHQPSSEVFHLFDRVLLLSEGRTLYDGAVHSLGAHLDALSLPVPDETNPADHIMFLMQTLEREKLAAMCDDYEAGKAKLDPHAVPPDVAAAAHLDGGLARRQAGLWTQFVTLGIREAQNVIRDRPALGARFGVTIMLNLLFGLLFLGIGDTTRSDYSVTSHFGALVMIGVSGMMGAAQVCASRAGPASLRLCRRCLCCCHLLRALTSHGFDIFRAAPPLTLHRDRRRSRSCCSSRRSGRGSCASMRRGPTAPSPTPAPSSSRSCR
jgi:hypothetical protein